MKIYIASGLQNHKAVRAVGTALRAQGHTITYDWTTHGSVRGQGAERLCEVAIKELDGVRNADLIIGMLPGGRGTHFELGVATALEKPILLYSKNKEDFSADGDTCSFYWLDTVYAASDPTQSAPEDFIACLLSDVDVRKRILRG